MVKDAHILINYGNKLRIDIYGSLFPQSESNIIQINDNTINDNTRRQSNVMQYEINMYHEEGNGANTAPKKQNIINYWIVDHDQIKLTMESA